MQRILQPIVMNTLQPSKPTVMDTKPFVNHEPLPVKPQEFSPFEGHVHQKQPEFTPLQCEEEKENQGAVVLPCQNKVGLSK